MGVGSSLIRDIRKIRFYFGALSLLISRMTLIYGFTYLYACKWRKHYGTYHLYLSAHPYARSLHHWTDLNQILKEDFLGSSYSFNLLSKYFPTWIHVRGFHFYLQLLFCLPCPSFYLLAKTHHAHQSPGMPTFYSVNAATWKNIHTSF